MGIDPISSSLEAIGTVATAAQKMLGMLFPDKTQEEISKISATVALLQQQTDIDKAEAQSSDPLQHWRGGMGWVCVLAYFYMFIFRPIAAPWYAFPPLDIGQLAALTAGMLGLGAMHVTEQMNK